MSVEHGIYLIGALSHTATLAVTWWGCVGVSGCDRVFVCHGEVMWVCLPLPHLGWNVCDVVGLCGGMTLTVIIQDF